MKLYINSTADLELCSRNPVNVEKIFTFDRIFRLFMIQFFFIDCQASSSKLPLLQFYCSFIGDRHETKCARQEITVLAQRLKIPFQVVFQSYQKYNIISATGKSTAAT